ncbi:MAG: helix-turn-helix domain-containing protein [Sphingobacteriales bacterium]|nr:MAG: helix-turn-helix domain-containing protein [Sphingobacteriales bacterium]
MLIEQKVRMIFGLKLRQLRQKGGWSLKGLAENCGISVSYLNEIEKGKKFPKTEKIVALSQALGVSYEEMVSLKVTKNLTPVAELLNSDFLKELPLEVFGIGIESLVEIISNAPVKVSAFISTIISITRNYEMPAELFLLATLRSYQELHDNYFEDLEEAAERFVAEFDLPPTLPVSAGHLQTLLAEQYNYRIEENHLGKFPELQGIRSVFVEHKDGNKLLLNNNLNPAQTAFQLAKELGYNYLQLSGRNNTQSWVRIKSFEQALNNFKASYFAGALFLNRHAVVRDVERFLASETFDGEQLLQIINSYNVSSDTFFHRLTSIAPTFLGLNELFFARVSHVKGSNHFDITKELHLPNLHNLHGNELNEHYCRRWVGISVLSELEQQQNNGKIPPEALVKVQRALSLTSGNEYFCISVARTAYPTPNTNSSVSIGFLINKKFMNKVRFWNDINVPVVLVSTTCERCKLNDCTERAAEPSVLKKQVFHNKLESKIKEAISGALEHKLPSEP